MKRIVNETHRSSDDVDCRKYGESYVKYYVEAYDYVVHSDRLYFDTNNIKVFKYELVNNEQVLSSFLNLGKQIYDEVLVDKIKKSNYMYDKYIKYANGYKLDYYSFREFIMFADKENFIIENIIISWCKKNPFYFKISIIDDEVDYNDINIYELAIIAVELYVIYSLYIRCITKIKTTLDSKTINNVSGLYSIYNYLLTKNSNVSSKKTYLDSFKNIDAYDVIENCKLLFVQLIHKYKLSSTSTSILKDSTPIKLHNTIISVVIDTIISTFYCEKKEILICKKCGNYYSGHGNSYLCEPCRKWNDNHKHIKNDRN